MSIVLITGDHPRHGHLVRSLIETGLVSGWVREVRESFEPEPPAGLSDDIKALFRRHFRRRAEAEEEFFGSDRSADIPTLSVSKEDLNSAQVIRFLGGHAPKLVLSYGCHKLSATTRDACGAVFWNTHGGLSPEYRGVTTHFWPSYFLEPQMTGMTLHETTDFLDGGGIVFQTAGSLVRGDGLHQLAARTVWEYAGQLSGQIARLDLSALPKGKPQNNSGRLFMSGDWRPEHLLNIYRHHEDQIVDQVLNGELTGRTPNLVSVI